MDPEIEKEIGKLKRMVAENIAISEKTNTMVRKLRRASRWSAFFSLLYWALILGALGASYFYVSPYVSKLTSFYDGLGSEQRAGFMQSLDRVFSSTAPATDATST